MNWTLFQIVKDASHAVDRTKFANRSTYGVFASTTSEMGELGTELTIVNGDSYKDPGKDGVVGEAIDTIICLLDLIHVHNPAITEEQLNQIAMEKSQKWVDKSS